MSDTTLGTLFTDNPSRDAVHFAIAPVTTNEILHPGQHVGLVKDSTTEVTARTKKLVGIVDPFLKTKVMPGDRFWLMLYQATVTGMRHHWAHPSFPDAVVPTSVTPPPVVDKTPYEVSFARLNVIADDIGISYERLMGGAKDYLDHGEYLCDGGRWEGGGFLPGDFWEHYEVVAGRKVAESERGSFFTCSC